MNKEEQEHVLQERLDAISKEAEKFGLVLISEGLFMYLFPEKGETPAKKMLVEYHKKLMLEEAGRA
jgi:hypothetical protein